MLVIDRDILLSKCLMENKMECVDERSVVALFTTESIKKIWTTNTSHGENDYREVIFALLESGNKIVVKVAANSFTTNERIRMWQRCAEEYARQGYYCPKILSSANGIFPFVFYKGITCIAYAEEYSKYISANQCKNVKPFREELYVMTAKIAQEKYDYTTFSSGYCLFDLFPGDEVDEVTENANEFRNYCKSLPELFHKQAERMFIRWEENREALKKVYFDLPFSVYQADFNDTNVLVNENGNFVGICDFNLSGKDEFLNYLFREIFTGSFDDELKEILKALRIVSKIYTFSEEEIEAAPLIYRCVKPLWYTRVEALKSFGSDYDKIQTCLNEMENAQIKEIDFRKAMQR